MPDLLDELKDWLRIPSISTAPGHEADLRRAAEWARVRIEGAGGRAEVVEDGGNPLVVGELRAATGDAPTVLAYGHYDVQDPGPLELWDSPPFEPTERDGRLYARGAADDKGNFLPLLHVACKLALAAELAVNVCFLIEGEEEAGCRTVIDWLGRDERGADCAVVFDSVMLDPETPALTTAARGTAAAWVRVRTGSRDLHSGIYGGAAPNAAHALAAMLAAVLPDAGGRLRPELRAGVVEPTAAEREAWSRLPAGLDFYERTWADASLDVNELRAGEPRTIVPATAGAMLSVRLAPGQRAEEIGAELERLLREAAPADAEVSVELELADPASFDPRAPALRLAAEALGRAAGREPALVRVGGTIPILAPLAERGIPTVLTGFVLDDDAIHAPNESFRLSSLALGERSARELYGALAAL